MRILIIEDDKEQCELLEYKLSKEGISTDLCHDGTDAEYYLENSEYDLVLLDNMLPHKSGIEILKEMRNKGNDVPVIMVTALGELSDRINGLDHGADDYIVKPYEFDELMAHIRCRMRRPGYSNNTEILSYGDISFNCTEKTLSGPAGKFDLSVKEAELIEMFLRNPGSVLARQSIMSRVWGADSDIEEGNIDNYIYFVRRRLKNVKSCVSVQTVRGVGYRLCSEEK